MLSLMSSLSLSFPSSVDFLENLFLGSPGSSGAISSSGALRLAALFRWSLLFWVLVRGAGNFLWSDDLVTGACQAPNQGKTLQDWALGVNPKPLYHERSPPRPSL